MFEFENEHQAAYALSSREQDTSIEVPATMFAVVVSRVAYCPFTDATLPRLSRCVVSLHGSRRMAEYHAAKFEVCEGDEEQVGVFPERPVDPTPVVLTGDDIPF